MVIGAAQKFNRGHRVLICSRYTNPNNSWENKHIGDEAIIEYSNLEKSFSSSEVYCSIPALIKYRLYIMPLNKNSFTLHWYEEEFLELICSNEEKGKTILMKNNR